MFFKTAFFMFFKVAFSLLSFFNMLFYFFAAFFSRGNYLISDAKVIAEISDAAKQRSTNSFTISRAEYENLKEAALDFFVVCEQESAGPILIKLNEQIIASTVPACDSLNRVELFREDFREGRNVLSFGIESGSYRIEQNRVRTILEPVETFLDYFTISSDLYNSVLDNERDIVLRIEFVDDGRRKKAQLNINGRFDVFDQTEPKYEKNLRTFIREGNNYLEVKPLTDLRITLLTIRAE